MPSGPVEVLRHDLRNHLNHLVGYGELLLEDADDIPAGSTEVLGRICGDSRQASVVLDAFDRGDGSFDAGEFSRRVELVAGWLETLKLGLANAGDCRFDAEVARMASAADSVVALAGQLATSRSAGATASNPERRGLRLGVGGETAEEGASRLILVVDDDADNRDLLVRRLNRLGYRVAVAENGVQALAVWAAEPVELVLLDLMMPDLDGFGVLERRSRDARLAETPVVMISSESDIKSVARCIEMGADDYLPKPFEPALLHARVRACLEKKQLRDAERDLLAELRHKTDQLSELNISLECRVSSQVEEINSLARLRRFLSPQLADLVVSSGENVLRSHRRQIAVLFCDLRGFTSFSETAEPEEVMDVLHEFHHAFGELTHRFGATVGYFAGDGIMVFFNDPLPCPNPPEQAVRMAVALRGAMAPMLSRWARRDHDLGFGVGIAYGYATLGEIGFEGRFDYGAIGNVVNLAARLCDHAASDQILMSRRAFLAVENLADSDEVGALTLKGIHAPVTVFNVVGLRSPTAAG